MNLHLTPKMTQRPKIIQLTMQLAMQLIPRQKQHTCRRSLCILIGCLLCITSYGQTATGNTPPENALVASFSYISDSLPIKLYNRPLLTPHENASSVGEITQGDAVTLIETNENQTWAKIKTASGLEGWIKKEWIQNHRSARTQVSELQTQLTQIQNTLLEKNQRIHALQQEIMQLKNESVGDAPPKMTTTHTLHPLLPTIQSAPLPTNESEIHKQLETSRILHEELRLENHILRENQYTQGLIHGTISLLLGVLLAIVLPKIKPKKRHENWGE